MVRINGKDFSSLWQSKLQSGNVEAKYMLVPQSETTGFFYFCNGYILGRVFVSIIADKEDINTRFYFALPRFKPKSKDLVLISRNEEDVVTVNYHDENTSFSFRPDKNLRPYDEFYNKHVTSTKPNVQITMDMKLMKNAASIASISPYGSTMFLTSETEPVRIQISKFEELLVFPMRRRFEESDVNLSLQRLLYNYTSQKAMLQENSFHCCPHCNHDLADVLKVSSSIRYCPYCGYILHKQEKQEEEQGIQDLQEMHKKKGDK